MTEALAPGRATSRVLLVDPDGAVLLMRQYGKSREVPPRWITTGGGVDPGEDWTAAAVRELAEETGLVVQVMPAPFRIDHFAADLRWHPYRTAHWAWFAVPSERFEPSRDGWMPDEHEDVVDVRWFTADELVASGEEYEPADLPALIRQAVARLR